MPRYFFHVGDGLSPLDDEGAELADIVEAREQAAVLAGGVLKDGAEGFWDGQPWTVRVADEAGVTLFTLHLTTSAPEAGPGFQKPLG